MLKKRKKLSEIYERKKSPFFNKKMSYLWIVLFNLRVTINMIKLDNMRIVRIIGISANQPNSENINLTSLPKL